MSLANWTTRILVGGSKADELSPDRREAQPDADSPKGGSSTEEQSFVGSRVGAYLVTKRLGAGGVGEVFKGVDVMLKREVAIKVLRDELTADPVFLARFRNEAQLQAKLSHPNVASVHAFLREGDKQLIVMEYVAGVSLDEFVRSGGPVPVQRALEIFRRALDGIEHAHGHGIVHRDIKPANIMLADSGQVKLMDFGIARALDSQEHLTRIGHVAGTAKAMSPEQIRGKQADVRSDVYSLGIVLYTLLAGRPPFDSGNDVELMKAQLEQPPPPLRGAIDGVPPPIEAAVMRALEKDPAARFQTVREFARAIDACMAALGMAAPSTGVRPAMDSPTTSRTAINPVLQGAKRLSAAEPAARAPHAANRGVPWAWLGAIALGVVALGGGGAVLWSVFVPGDRGAAPSRAGTAVQPAATPQPAATAQASVSPPVAAPPTAVPPPDASAPPMEPAPTPAAPPAATTAAPTVAAVDPAPRETAPPSTVATPTLPLRVEPAAAPALSITRLDAAAAPNRFRPGERIELSITPSRDAHVYCYLQDESRRILRFFPNRFRQSSLVRSVEPLRIPGGMRFELVANTLRVTETVACFASDRDVSGELPAAVLGGDFEKLAVGSLDELKGAFARAAGDSLAQASFQVQFK